MLSDDDVIKITVNQDRTGIEMLNVFWYLIELTVAGIELIDVLDDFKTRVWDLVRESQHPIVETLSFDIANVTNGIDVDNLASGDVGLDITGGAVMPDYVAAGYSLEVGSLLTRPGGKRIGGIGEDRVAGNGYDAGGTIVADIEDGIADTLQITGQPVGAGNGIPVVVGRTPLGVPDLTRLGVVVSVLGKPLIRSQVSRRQ